MKRTILACAIALIAVDAQAQSSVTLYGSVGGGMRWIGGANGGSQIGFDHALAGTTFGLRGVEDLGQGMRAVFKLEGGSDTGTGKQAKPGLLFSKMAYVGLSGAYGIVTMGRQINAAEEVGITLDPYSAQANSLAIVPGVAWAGNAFTLDTRFNDTIKYVGRAGGLTVRASYSPGGVAGTLRAGSNSAFGTTWQYQTLLLGAAYQKTYNADATQWAQTAMGGGAWQIGPARLYLSYSDLTISAATAGAPKRRDSIPGVGLVYQITPALQFTAATYYDIGRNLKNVPGADGRKLTTYAIFEYFLSKRTELYVEFDRNGFSGAYKKDPVNISALNLRPDGRAVTGVSIGMITQF